MDFLQFLKENIVILDGGMGTLLQSRGLSSGELPELWNVSHPDAVIEIHKAYFEAGSNVVSANTFGANSLKFKDDELEGIIAAAFSNAKAARDEAGGEKERFIALDIGPTGRLLKPLGDLDFEAAVEVFAKTVSLGVKYGAELIIIETMNDSYETKAALLAVKENSSLPVIVTNAYGADGCLMTGASPEAMAALLEGMGADAIGANCSLGPKQLAPVIERLLDVSSVPVVLKPNAGLPRLINGETSFDVTSDEFALEVLRLVKKGVRVIGGCCGTTPEYIKKLSEAAAGSECRPIEKKNITAVSSYSHAVVLGESPVLIGERINPTGKKRFKQALIENDIGYILNQGIAQQEKGVHILDVNVGIPEIDETEMLKTAVCELQAVTNLPLQLDTANPTAMEAALRCYNGKAMINSVNGKSDSMKAVFPLVKKYGGVVVGLTLDEEGIPETAEGRVEIARKILRTAEGYGIDKKDIIFDTLAMTVSADKFAAMQTLKALKAITEELGCKTSLGVSNVSFGLPCRNALNSVFFALALENGLSAAIMNPFSGDMLKAYYSYKALKGFDADFAEYIAAADDFAADEGVAASAPKAKLEESFSSKLQRAIIKGLKAEAATLTKAALEAAEALEIVNSEVIPALNSVGSGFENKTVYLPQLLMSAEAAQAAFEVIKSHVIMSGKKSQEKAVVVLATVKGDIHDIGKNIVKLLLENYGFRVVDLGKDVSPEKIVEAVREYNAPLAGLSALMTTTVPSMEEALRLLKAQAPWCKTVVGGAVLTREYAEKIGADFYASDAMETVRYAEKVVNNGGF